MSRKKERKRLRDLSAEEWEAICERCGQCCYERIIMPDGAIVAWGEPCAWLDPESRLCTAYERRLSLDVTCKRITPRLVMQRPHLLPAGCAYLRWRDER